MSSAAADTAVDYRLQNGLVWLTLRNPKVNAINRVMREGLVAAVVRANQETPTPRALIVRGSGDTFVAGADIKELGTPHEPPMLRDVVNALEQSVVPTVAAIDGHALGGGLEIALACHARVSTARASLGLPEVTLGLIPGAGGTQRLPRLVGAAPALALMTSGTPVNGITALSMGLVDQVVESVRDDAAVEAFVSSRTVWPRTSEREDRVVGVDARAVCAGWRVMHEPSWAGQLAPVKVVEAVERAFTLPFEQGLAFERDAFLECRGSCQRKALSYLFFAEREATKWPAANEVEAEMKPVEVIGEGEAAARLASWVSGLTGPSKAVAPRPSGHVPGVCLRPKLVEIALGHGADETLVPLLIARAKHDGKRAVVTRPTSSHFLCEVLTAQTAYDELAQLVRAGVFSRESDVDVLLVNAGHCPRHEGGPMFAQAQRA